MRCPSCRAENTGDQSFCGTCGAKLPAPALPETPPTTMAHAPDDLATGDTLAGRYQVIEELGHGGMGRVYKVFDTEVKERIALKLLRPELSADRDAVERFSRELALARRIAHRNVCRLFDLGRADRLSYITMEYVSGDDLRRLMRKVGVLGAGQAVRIARQVCDGLSEAHRLGVVHRDLKPQNVMVDEDGNAKIMDFGIACLVQGSRITGAGVIIGTPQYMSPEQVEGGHVDQRSDIYSLGVMLYEMTTGRVPFEGDTPLSVAHKQKYDAPADPRTLNAQLSPDLAGLILKCLAKDKKARYESAAEVRVDLERIERGLPTTERVAAQKRTTSTQITIPFGPRRLAVIAAVVVLAAAGLFFWRPWSPKIPISPKSGKPRVAVTWFDNQSERKNLDRNVVTLLTANLTRDESLDVVSSQTMTAILRQIPEADIATMDRAIANTIASKAEAGTMVTGAIITLGDQVRISAELVNVATGGVVAAFQEDGRRIDDVLPMVDRLTSQIRARLAGSSKASGPELKIADVSTTSLEAYDHFQRGWDLLLRWNPAAAAKELEQAVAIDPNFAGAWVGLAQARVGWTYLTDPFADGSRALEALAEAKKVAVKATERERLQIDVMQAFLDRDYAEVGKRGERLAARYPDDGWGNIGIMVGRTSEQDVSGVITAAQRYLEINPTDANTYNMLAYAQSQLGDHKAAVSSIKKYMALHPDVGNAFDSAVEIYLRAGLFDEALAITERWRKARPTGYNPRRYAAWTLLMKGDPDRARREVLAAPEGSPLTQATDEGLTYLAEGRYREAEAAYRKAVGIAEGTRRKADQASPTGLAGLRDAHFGLGRMLTVEGRMAEALREFDAGMEASAGRVKGQGDPYGVPGRYLKGVVFARQGNWQGASKMAEEIGDLVKRLGFTSMLLQYRDALAAEVAAARKDLPALAKVNGFWMFGSISPIVWRPLLVRSILRGEFAPAAQAVEDFRTNISAAKTWPGNSFWYFCERSRLDYTLGQIYEQQGDAAKAREAYGRFLTLMAKADAGLPEVEDAKKRMDVLGKK
jgi:serine/threonine protein kinase/tetratricopeptide (TPR) repeat protein